MTFIKIVMDYKDLPIDRAEIEKSIKSFCSGIKVDQKRISDGFIKFNVSVPKQVDDCTVNVYFKNDGNTSFSSHEGKNRVLGDKIIEYVIKNTLFDPKFNSPIYIKKLSQDSLDQLFDFLTGYCGAELVGVKNLTHGKKHEFKSKYGDSIHLNYYNSGSFNVQGKCALLKSQVVEGLSSYLPFGEIIDITLKSFDISEFSKSDAEKLMESRLPIASQTIKNTVKSVLLPSFITQQIVVETTDYSFMVFPALRGIEGYLKQLFLDNGITAETIGDHVNDAAKTGSARMSTTAESVISCNFTKRSIERLYNFFKQHRHAVFHVDGTLIGTRLIVKREDAISLINECLDMIEKCANTIHHKNMKHLI